MADRRLIQLSKFMSLVLRHQPERFGVVLDAEGFTPLADLLEAIRKGRPDVTEADLRAVVTGVEPEKQRYSIIETEIRANYGHSVDGRIRQEPAVPPATLLHGTTDQHLSAILAGGLLPMSRQYVHLTEDRALALRVGGRRGRPRLVRVAALRAHEAGVPFYVANRAFWLADRVPAEYVSAE